MVEPIFNRKHQFREYRRFTVFTQTCDAIFQDRLLDQARFPACAQTKTKGHKRCLPVCGMQRVDFILQRLESVIALFFRARFSKRFRAVNIPFTGNL
ncbi:Uncharacterised protein [Vibrio cholerae]|nr:Uncharacterised protein [Vibrio cholerae]CSC76183.1 Uncharacterised protein [Vibrio cholerae]CSD31754.1 Uncharacterised protein [Vibrio cholerae]